MIALLQDNHFWVGLAFLLLLIVLVWAGVPALAAKALDAKGAKIQAQLDEATRIREEAQALLARIKAEQAESEKAAAEMLATAKSEAARLAKEAEAKLAEQIKRRGELAERKIATAEASAAAEVKAAAADLAAQIAERVLTTRVATAKSDALVDRAIADIAGKLQ